MDNEKQKIYYGWWIVLAGFIIYAMVYSTNSSGSVFTVAITEELGFSRSAYAMQSLFSAIGSITGCYVMGKVIARHDIKKIMLFATTGLAAVYVIKTFCTEIWQFYLVQIFTGFVFASSTMMTVPVLINRWFGPKKKGLAMSLTMAGSGLGGMLMTSILGRLNVIYGWRTTFYIQAAIILLTAIPIILLVVVRSPKDKGLERLGETPAQKQQAEKEGISYIEARKTPAFWMVLSGFLLMAMVNAGITGHRIPYLTQVYNDPVQAANIGSLAIGGLMLGKLLLGSVCDKIGIKRGVLFGNILNVLALVAFYGATGIHSLSYLFIAFYAVGGAVGTVAIPLMVSAVFGEKDFSKYLSVINISTGIGAPLGSIFCGTVFDMVGGYTNAWLVLAAVMTISVILLFTCFSFRPWSKTEAGKERQSAVNGGSRDAKVN